MSQYCRDVQLFQNKFGFSVPSDFTFVDQELFDFRVKFFYEELDEYKEAVASEDLATAVDSLIDLVYIACGTAIFHGVGYDKFDDILVDVDPAAIFPYSKGQTGIPHFLSPRQSSLFCSLVESEIINYIDGYAAKSEKKIKSAIAAIYLDCMSASTAMDLTDAQWDELWSDVQRANMSKERALSATQSKRGSTYDIIKPSGWAPPKTEELIAKYLAGRTE